MVGTTIAKGQIPDIRWTYTKGIINLREAFNDKIYIVSMGMNTKFKVDSHFSNAYPFIYFSYFDNDISCRKFFLMQYQISMTREIFRVNMD